MRQSLLKGFIPLAAVVLAAGCGEINEENIDEGGREGGNDNNLEINNDLDSNEGEE